MDVITQRIYHIHVAVLQSERDDVTVILSAVSEVTTRRCVQITIRHVQRGPVLLDLRRPRDSQWEAAVVKFLAVRRGELVHVAVDARSVDPLS